MLFILLQDFIGDLKAQRTRAFLTFFAVAWGTLAVVLLLAFGEGLKGTIRDGLLGAGERIFMVYGGETSKSFAGLGQGRRIRLVKKTSTSSRARSRISTGGVSRTGAGAPRSSSARPAPTHSSRASVPITSPCDTWSRRRAGGSSTRSTSHRSGACCSWATSWRSGSSVAPWSG